MYSKKQAPPIFMVLIRKLLRLIVTNPISGSNEANSTTERPMHMPTTKSTPTRNGEAALTDRMAILAGPGVMLAIRANREKLIKLTGDLLCLFVKYHRVAFPGA